MQVRSFNDMDVKPTYDASDAARWTGGQWLTPPESPLTGVSIDSRAVEEGDLFIAVKGERTDGHRFLHDALARGASAVMLSDRAALNGMHVPALLVADTRNALRDLARRYRDMLTCRMVSVTGSVGKTTVKELAADMLQHIGLTARSRGNWNNDLGMPLSLLGARPDAAFGVFEVGMNHPGELDPLCGILRPHVSIITGIGPVHIENFDSEEGIAREKAAVFRALPDDGVAVFNRDDRFAALLAGCAGERRTVTVSARPGADYVYERTDPARGAFIIRETASGESVDCRAPIPGEYFVLDAVLAAAAARVCGAGWRAVADAVRNYRPLSMRWSRDVHAGVLVINDAYNANPVSMRSALHAFGEERVAGRRWAVLGGMLELGSREEADHRETGRCAAGVDGLGLVTVGPRGRWIAAGAREAGMKDVFDCGEAAEAAAVLAGHLHEGDAVLLKGSRGERVEQVLDQWIQLLEVNGENQES